MERYVLVFLLNKQGKLEKEKQGVVQLLKVLRRDFLFDQLSCNCYSIVWEERELILRARQVLIKSKCFESV